MKVLIAIDSFKSCISSLDAGRAAAAAFGADDDVTVLDVSDGGDGFLGAVRSCLDCVTVNVHVHGPLGHPLEAEYLMAGDTAFVESAGASGIGLLEKDELDPVHASTFGTGEMVADAMRRGARRIYIGLGGTCTNDGGRGFLAALASSAPDTDGVEFIGLCDTDAVFCGPRGASYVYGPQKGAKPEQLPMLDAALHELAVSYKEVMGRDVLSHPGSGAAGGLGGAIWSVLGGELKSGAEAVLDIVGFDRLAKDCDLVITGEGRMDGQTLTGKLPCMVARRTRRICPDAKVVAVTGCDKLGDNDVFDTVLQSTPEGMPLDEALRPQTATACITSVLRGWLGN